ncbi:MAG: hypothetical protein HYZ53_23955 [Planctomycetes bacterium]|nr:hypothetical protein [Planctomycetota bacterium]
MWRHRDVRRAAVLLACLVVSRAPAGAGAADESPVFRLRPVCTAGESSVREQTLRLTCDTNVVLSYGIEGQTGKQDSDFAVEHQTREQAKTVVLATDADGRRTECRTEYVRHETKRRVTRDGEEQALPTLEDPFEGRTFVLVREGEALRVTVAKGGEVAEDARAALSLEDADACLLPSGSVKVGDRWRVEGQALSPLLAPARLLRQEPKGAAPEVVSGVAECVLAEVQESTGPAAARIARITYQLEAELRPVVPGTLSAAASGGSGATARDATAADAGAGAGEAVAYLIRMSSRGEVRLDAAGGRLLKSVTNSRRQVRPPARRASEA